MRPRIARAPERRLKFHGIEWNQPARQAFSF
jgi:hypothetical protein